MSRRRARCVRCSSASAARSRGQLGDAVADLAAVELQAAIRPRPCRRCRRAGDPCPCAALLAQARDQVLQADDLDLGLGGARARVAVEDLQDDRGAVEHLDAGRLLEVARLRRRDVVIDQHGSMARRLLDRARRLLAVAGLARGRGQRHQLGELAAADHGAGVQRLAALGHRGHDLDAQRAPQAVQLRDRRGEGVVVGVGELDRDDGGAERAGGVFGQRGRHRGGDI